MKVITGLVLATFISPAFVSGVYGQPGSVGANPNPEPRHLLVRDVLPGFLAGTVASALFLYDIRQNSPEARWTTPGALDRGIRDSLHLKENSRENAALCSDVLYLGAATGSFLAALTLPESSPGRRTDNIIHVWNSLSYTIVLTQAAKMTFARERPYSYFESDPGSKLHGYDAYRSFFSGHTSITFAGTFSLAALLSQSAGSQREKALYFTAAALLGGLTGYLRIAADRHYFTDVIAGAGAGALVTLHSFYGHSGSAGAAYRSSVKTNIQFKRSAILAGFYYFF